MINWANLVKKKWEINFVKSKCCKLILKNSWKQIFTHHSLTGKFNVILPATFSPYFIYPKKATVIYKQVTIIILVLSTGKNMKIKIWFDEYFLILIVITSVASSQFVFVFHLIFNWKYNSDTFKSINSCTKKQRKLSPEIKKIREIKLLPSKKNNFDIPNIYFTYNVAYFFASQDGGKSWTK